MMNLSSAVAAASSASTSSDSGPLDASEARSRIGGLLDALLSANPALHHNAFARFLSAAHSVKATESRTPSRKSRFRALTPGKASASSVADVDDMVSNEHMAPPTLMPRSLALPLLPAMVNLCMIDVIVSFLRYSNCAIFICVSSTRASVFRSHGSKR
jgi:hypothetical protein